MMVLQKKGGIGASGSPFVRFIHPTRLIQAKWPNTWKQHQSIGAVICGKGMKNVSCCDQMCYEIHLAVYGEDQVFHIVCCNFKVLVEGLEPFDDEGGVPQIVAAPILAPVEGGNMDLGVKQDGNIATMLLLEIGELTANGVLVDNEGPAPENAVSQPITQTKVGMWEKQLICIHRNNTTIMDTNGQWKLNSWKQICLMMEFAFFSVGLPRRIHQDCHHPSNKYTLAW